MTSPDWELHGDRATRYSRGLGHAELEQLLARLRVLRLEREKAERRIRELRKRIEERRSATPSQLPTKR